MLDLQWKTSIPIPYISDNPRKRLEEEELEVYGTGEKTSVQLTSFTFEVCDSVQNIAPVGFMTVGERYTEEFVKTENEVAAKSNLEVVTSSGRGKNGALCVLQSTIKPHIITSFTLSGCRDVWTVFDDPNQEGGDKHKFMILSQKSSTMVGRKKNPFRTPCVHVVGRLILLSFQDSSNGR